MSKVTLGISLTVASERWSISTTSSGVGSAKQLKQWVDWIYAEGCRRLQAPGKQPDLPVTFAVVGHIDQRRVGDENDDLVSHVSPTAARLVIVHLALEAVTALIEDA